MQIAQQFALLSNLQIAQQFALLTEFFARAYGAKTPIETPQNRLYRRVENHNFRATHTMPVYIILYTPYSRKAWPRARIDMGRLGPCLLLIRGLPIQRGVQSFKRGSHMEKLSLTVQYCKQKNNKRIKNVPFRGCLRTQNLNSRSQKNNRSGGASEPETLIAVPAR